MHAGNLPSNPSITTTNTLHSASLPDTIELHLLAGTIAPVESSRGAQPLLACSQGHCHGFIWDQSELQVADALAAPSPAATGSWLYQLAASQPETGQVLPLLGNLSPLCAFPLQEHSQAGSIMLWQ
jgi:hypothetical protein